MSERKIHKRSGFKNYSDVFWRNERGRYGCRYQCKHCGKTTLGLGSDSSMHWPACPVRNSTKGQP